MVSLFCSFHLLASLKYNHLKYFNSFDFVTHEKPHSKMICTIQYVQNTALKTYQIMSQCILVTVLRYRHLRN